MGREMQDDVTDGTRWLVQQGIADADRLCIMGASYGGFAALWGAVKTPHQFKCAISFAGVSDWRFQLDRARRLVNYEAAKEQYGPRDRLAEVSAVDHAERIVIPVLLMHGDQDRVVDIRNSRKMANALKKHGKEYEFLEFENGSHHLLIEANRTRFLMETEEFLAKHLGPALTAVKNPAMD